MVGTARLLHVHTPTLQAIDARGLVVRSVGWHRQTDGDSAVARIHRAAFDLDGRKTHRWDARLFVEESARANLTHIHSLSGQVLGRDSVDSGWQVSLPGDAGQVRASWDGRGTRRRVDYDGLLRSVAIFEKPAQALEQCIELFDYAGPQDNPANQCGQLTRHDDMVGSVSYSQFGISGVVLEQARRFLTGLELPNWPGSVSLLEAGSGASTRWRYGPAGDVLQETDTMGNVRLYSQTVSGELRQFRLNTPEQGVRTLISDMVYDAQGRLSCEITGNGVVTSLHNDPLDGRLTRVSTDYGQRQDLHYTYDPVGNVVSIQDHAQPTRYFANQQIEPLRTFAYDTLYQLIEATGYEAVDTRRGLGTDKCRQVSTGNELVLYTERYEYDAGRNLRTLVHVGARNFTRRFATAWDSNRSLLDTGAQPPNEEQIANAFDANGNLRALQPDQTLQWDVRDQLSEVTPVVRESGVNDSEVYRYDAAGMRVRKVRITQAKTVTHHNEVRYLPGLEIRTNTATGEVLHVVTAKAGRSDVRVLHWQAGKPESLENDQIRYSLSDHLGSSTLELDAEAQLISQETYYPYGETAWFAGRSDVEVCYKTIRYSGKERDATGLYYYGLRYYAPWLMRWINPDPAGERGGINFYEMVNGNPLKYVDRHGDAPEVPKDIHYIWIGQSNALSRYVPNIEEAALLNYDFTVNVHVDLKDGDTGAEYIEKALSKFKNIKVTQLRNEPFFTSFKSSPSYAVYADLFGDGARNYASATDVLRYSLINHYGGIYVDVDDQFKRGVRPGDFTPKKNRVFTVGPVNPPWDANEYVINNNAFASHSQNPTLLALSNEVTARYKAQQASASGLRLSAMPAGNEKMKIVSQVTGPKVFTSVLTSRDQKLRKLFDAMVARDQSDKPLKNPDRHHAQREKRMPISRFIKMGQAHTWR